MHRRYCKHRRTHQTLQNGMVIVVHVMPASLHTSSTSSSFPKSNLRDCVRSSYSGNIIVSLRNDDCSAAVGATDMGFFGGWAEVRLRHGTFQPAQHETTSPSQPAQLSPKKILGMSQIAHVSTAPETRPSPRRSPTPGINRSQTPARMVGARQAQSRRWALGRG